MSIVLLVRSADNVELALEGSPAGSWFLGGRSSGLWLKSTRYSRYGSVATWIRDLPAWSGSGGTQGRGRNRWACRANQRVLRRRLRWGSDDPSGSPVCGPSGTAASSARSSGSPPLSASRRTGFSRRSTQRSPGGIEALAELRGTHLRLIADTGFVDDREHGTLSLRSRR